MPLPGSNREKAMQKQFLQEIVEPEVQVEETAEEEVVNEQPKPKKRKSKKKVLGLF